MPTRANQVTVGENENAESAIRRFRKAVMSSGHIQEVREIARDDATTMTTTARGSGFGENRENRVIRAERRERGREGASNAMMYTNEHAD